MRVSFRKSGYSLNFCARCGELLEFYMVISWFVWFIYLIIYLVCPVLHLSDRCRFAAISRHYTATACFYTARDAVILGRYEILMYNSGYRNLSASNSRIDFSP